MFGFLGTRKAAGADAPRTRLVGLDLTATRARAVASGDGRTRPLVLDGDAHELPLFLNLDHKPPVVGSAAVAVIRRLPHVVCSNFLPLLGLAHEWRVGKKTMTPESALQAALDVVRPAVAAETATAGLALPSYLTPVQVKKVQELTAAARLPVRGSAVAPLAVVAHRAASVVGPRPGDPAAVLVLDADEYALSGAVLAVTPTDVRVVSVAHWPHLSVRLWKERLIDGMSDRCVRLCRRDPRDSAAAEQVIYDQLDEALDKIRQGQKATLTVRAEHWFQDLVHQPDEMEGYCTHLVAAAVEGIKQLLIDGRLAVPVRAVWLTHTAGRLPGLAARIYRTTPEHTSVSILPVNAAAEAAAALVPRWLAGSLPRGHLDSAVPFERPLTPAAPPAVAGIGSTSASGQRPALPRK